MNIDLLRTLSSVNQECTGNLQLNQNEDNCKSRAGSIQLSRAPPLHVLPHVCRVSPQLLRGHLDLLFAAYLNPRTSPAWIVFFLGSGCSEF